MSTRSAHRHAVVLVAPLVTFLAVILMLVVAHFYDRMPVQLGKCGFLERTGIPCLGCGGTRSMQALSHGQVMTALSFHPAFVMGVFLTPLWLGFGIRRYWRGDHLPPVEQQNSRLKRGLLVGGVSLGLNWAYLIFFLP